MLAGVDVPAAVAVAVFVVIVLFQLGDFVAIDVVKVCMTIVAHGIFDVSTGNEVILVVDDFVIITGDIAFGIYRGFGMLAGIGMSAVPAIAVLVIMAIQLFLNITFGTAHAAVTVITVYDVHAGADLVMITVVKGLVGAVDEIVPCIEVFLGMIAGVYVAAVIALTGFGIVIVSSLFDSVFAFGFVETLKAHGAVVVFNESTDIIVISVVALDLHIFTVLDVAVVTELVLVRAFMHAVYAHSVVIPVLVFFTSGTDLDKIEFIFTDSAEIILDKSTFVVVIPVVARDLFVYAVDDVGVSLEIALVGALMSAVETYTVFVIMGALLASGSDIYIVVFQSALIAVIVFDKGADIVVIFVVAFYLLVCEFAVGSVADIVVMSYAILGMRAFMAAVAADAVDVVMVVLLTAGTVFGHVYLFPTDVAVIVFDKGTDIVMIPVVALDLFVYTAFDVGIMIAVSCGMRTLMTAVDAYAIAVVAVGGCFGHSVFFGAIEIHVAVRAAIVINTSICGCMVNVVALYFSVSIVIGTPNLKAVGVLTGVDVVAGCAYTFVVIGVEICFCFGIFFRNVECCVTVNAIFVIDTCIGNGVILVVAFDLGVSPVVGRIIRINAFLGMFAGVDVTAGGANTVIVVIVVICISHGSAGGIIEAEAAVPTAIEIDACSIIVVVIVVAFDFGIRPIDVVIVRINAVLGMFAGVDVAAFHTNALIVVIVDVVV